MKDSQENKISSYHTIDRVLQRHSALYSGAAGSLAVVTEFRGKVSAIDSVLRKQGLRKTGVAVTKAMRREEMCKLASRTAAGMRVYANSTGNEALLPAVDFSLADLMALRDAEVAVRCKGILETATEHAEGVAAYGVTEEMLDDLSEMIEDFEDVESGPRDVRGIGKAATAQLADLIAETDQLLAKKLDDVVEGFRTTNRDFWEEYQAARTIDDLGRRKRDKKPDEPTTDTGEGEPSGGDAGVG